MFLVRIIRSLIHRVSVVKTLIVICVVAVLWPVFLCAQSTRSVEASADVRSYRNVGDLRVWTYTYMAKDMGRLISVVKDSTKIDGRVALIIQDSLHIDFAEMRLERVISNWGEHIVDNKGRYLGDDLSVGSDSAWEEMHFRLEGSSSPFEVTGYFTRSGEEIERSVALPRRMFAWDAHFLSQLEIWLAMQDLAVGDTLIDTLFVPQTMMTTPILARVDNFTYMELYKGKFDSVFAIQFAQPQRYAAFFTPDKKLVRFDFLNEKIRVYQDLVGRAVPKSARSPATPAADLFSVAMRGLFYMVSGIVALLLLTARGYRWLSSYIALAAGVALDVAVIFLATPLQTMLVGLLAGPGEELTGAIYLWWVVPSVVFGFFQELLKAVAILLVLRWLKVRAHRCAAVGAFLGVGFGLFEAIYMTASGIGSGLFDWSLLNYIFLIIFHASAGALVGGVMAAGWRRATGFVLLATGLNALIRYLSIFALRGVMQPQLVYLITAVVSLVFLMVVVLFMKKVAVPTARQ